MYLLLISVHQGDDSEYDEDCLAANNLDCLRHGVLRAQSHSASLECKSARVDGGGYGHTHSRAPLRQVKLVNLVNLFA